MKKLLLPFFLLGSLLMIYIMMKTGATLKTPATPLGILNLEFAYKESKATAVINAWIPSGNINAARVNTYWDFVFLFFYSFFLFFACKQIAANLKGTVAKAGNLVAKAALLAGFLDILENAGMLYTLSGTVSDSIAFLTTFISVIKWILAVIAVLYVLTGALVLGYRKYMT
ncbi:MAG TPA: hypothetical protein VK489_12805 [Ferruginibacter sp.]|nr:hypothetical protein [Ferruginibacter sp.]